MNGLSPHRIPELVHSDVEHVLKEARIVLTIRGNAIIQTRNPAGGLGIIAVLGPGDFNGQHFNQALLCEIGLVKSRPYHRANRPATKNSQGQYLSKRRKWFSLNKSQYLLAAPIIFSLLRQLTNKAVSQRKANIDNPFYLPTSRHYFSRYHNTLFKSVSFQPQLQGSRFSICLEDEFFVRDIYWADLNNPATKNRLKGMAKFIDLYLSSYKKGFRRRFLKLKKVKKVQMFLYRRGQSIYWPRHHEIEMLSHLPSGKRNPLWSHLTSDLIHWDGEKTRERCLAEAAPANPESRLGQIRLIVTTSLNGQNKYRIVPKFRDHIVFEVFPSSSS